MCIVRHIGLHGHIILGSQAIYGGHLDKCGFAREGLLWSFIDLREKDSFGASSICEPLFAASTFTSLILLNLDGKDD